MAKITIKNFGPIKSATLDIKKINILFGTQASGKSTICKLIYFFNEFPSNLINIIDNNSEKSTLPIESQCNIELREEFKKNFGPFINPSSLIKFEYKPRYSITIEKNSILFSKPLITGMNVVLSAIQAIPSKIDNIFSNSDDFKLTPMSQDIEIEKSKERLRLQAKAKKNFEHLLKLNYSNIFIPASRSSINRLKSYSKIITNAEQNFNMQLDWTVSDFIMKYEFISRAFKNGISGQTTYANSFTSKIKQNIKKQKKLFGDITITILEELDERLKITNAAKDLYLRILKGEYKIADDGTEFLQIGNDNIPFDFASSGQRESVSILNTISWLINSSPNNVFIEEPEAHLFPEAQMYIASMIALLVKRGHSVFITTHSPYILSAINNLIYANNLKNPDGSNADDINSVVEDIYQLDINDVSASFIADKKLISIIDPENNLIDSSYIDSASDLINDTFNKLIDIEFNTTEE